MCRVWLYYGPTMHVRTIACLRKLTSAWPRLTLTQCPTIRATCSSTTDWKSSVKRHVSGRTILDVGCGDGVFLSLMSSEWSKQGLEPSATGATLARKRNLDVANATLDTAARQYQADVVSALDVIEHVIDPHNFVESFKRHLRPGGVVLLLTGDADSMPAKTAGPQWSYLRWCGHISVFSGSGLRKLLESHGYEILAWNRCEHTPLVRDRLHGGACICWSLCGECWDETDRGIHSGATIKWFLPA